jgi:hypothetical protein
LLPGSKADKSTNRIETRETSEILNMSKVHRNPPFRAEHLGSLLRPKDFLAQRSAFEKSEISQEVLTKAEDEAIAAVVKVQLENNFHAITDGEYRYILMPKNLKRLGLMNSVDEQFSGETSLRS